MSEEKVEDSYKLVRSFEGNISEPEGEKIREVFSNGEIGIAEAEVEDAELHYHEEMEEIYYVVEGEGKMVLDEEEMDLEEGDLIYIPSEVQHRAWGGFKVLVISKPPWSERDHHLVME